jgi:hypothetical protein
VLGEEVELGSNRCEDGESEAKELQERWQRVELEVSIEQERRWRWSCQKRPEEQSKHQCLSSTACVRYWTGIDFFHMGPTLTPPDLHCRTDVLLEIVLAACFMVSSESSECYISYWDQIAEGYLIPNTWKNVKLNKQMVGSEGVKHSVDDNKCTGFLFLGESPGGPFIGVVRGSGNNV